MYSPMVDLFAGSPMSDLGLVSEATMSPESRLERLEQLEGLPSLEQLDDLLASTFTTPTAYSSQSDFDFFHKVQ